MEYWTIIDDRHAGPFSAAELLEKGLSAGTPVWYSGLPDWVEASEVEELRLLLRQQEEEESARECAPANPSGPHPGPTPEPVAEEPAPMPEPQPQQPWQPYSQPYQPQPQPQFQQWSQPVQPEPQPLPRESEPRWDWQREAVALDEPYPPAYLVWSIIVTILCCMPLGIAAIVCSAQVKQAYNRGNMEKARKMSEWAQWCIILSIVLGLVWLPVQLVFAGI